MKLVRTGDSIMVTVPAPVARRWLKAGAVAVAWELDGDTLRATPQVFVEHRYHDIRVPLKEVANAGHNDKS